MANPLSAQTLTEFSSKSNLTSLAAGDAKPLGDVDCSAEVYFDAEVTPIRFKTDAAGWGAGDKLSLYLIHTTSALATAAEWTDGINPDSTTDVSGSLNSAALVQTVEATANSTSYTFDGFSVRDILGFVPFGWTVVVYNEGATGSDLTSTAGDHFAKYRLIKYA